MNIAQSESLDKAQQVEEEKIVDTQDMVNEAEFVYEDNEELLKQINIFAQDLNFCLKYKLLRIPFCVNYHLRMNLSDLTSSPHNKVWRCSGNNCKKRYVSIYNGNPIFEQWNLKLPKLLHGLFVLIPNLTSIQMLTKTSTWSNQQVYKARELYETLIEIYYHQIFYDQFTQLGESGSVVELDETMFKRKYNKGSINKRQWIFGFCERGSCWNRTLFFPVEDRTSNTLIPIVRQFVSKDCAFVCTDKWRSYNSLKDEGFSHEQVNHSTNFVVSSKAQKKRKKKRQNAQSQGKPERNYKLIGGYKINTQTIEFR